MKQPDEKKKIFGRFNIVDLIILIIIIGILCAGAYKVISSSNTAQTTKTITYTVRVRGADSEVFDEVQKYIPSQLVSSGEMIDGNVISAVKETNTKHYLEIDNTSGKIYTEDTDKVDILFTITAAIEPDNAKTEVGSQEVRIGRTHYVKTLYFELEGTIISVEGR